VQEREPGQQQQQEQPRQREDIFKVKRHKALWSALISLCVVFFFFHPSLYLVTSSSSSPSRPTLHNPDRMASIRPGTPSTR
jgi:ABC-type Fe3+ transport system permease subunit